MTMSCLPYGPRSGPGGNHENQTDALSQVDIDFMTFSRKRMGSRSPLFASALVRIRPCSRRCAQPMHFRRVGMARRAFADASRLLRLLRRPQNRAALRMRYLHRHWPGINPPLLQTAALPAGQLMEQGGEPCAEQKL